MTSYKEWKRSLAKLSEEQMFPLTVECELTSKCNFSCEMCYVKDNQSKDALSLEKWYQLFDEAIEAGALFFVLTGGEPLSHPDFWKIYRYLADKGVKITLFTNGSFLDEEAVSRFTKNPPEMIVISLYGHNQETVCAASAKFQPRSSAQVLRVPDARRLERRGDRAPLHDGQVRFSCSGDGCGDWPGLLPGGEPSLPGLP